MEGTCKICSYFLFLDPTLCKTYTMFTWILLALVLILLILFLIVVFFVRRTPKWPPPHQNNTRQPSVFSVSGRSVGGTSSFQAVPQPRQHTFLGTSQRRQRHSQQFQANSPHVQRSPSVMVMGSPGAGSRRSNHKWRETVTDYRL